MASELIGRMACPECDFPHAHVKIKTDKDGANPYRHCPDCGAQYFARSSRQAENLRKKMRPEGAPVPAPELAQVPAPEPRYTTVLGVRVPL